MSRDLKDEEEFTGLKSGGWGEEALQRFCGSWSMESKDLKLSSVTDAET